MERGKNKQCQPKYLPLSLNLKTIKTNMSSNKENRRPSQHPGCPLQRSGDRSWLIFTIQSEYRMANEE